MGHDADMVRFFIYLNLFIFFMLVLVMGDNLLLLFVGWEGVGLCSYLLSVFGTTITTTPSPAIRRSSSIASAIGVSS